MIYMIMLLICDNHFVRVCVYVCVCMCVCMPCNSVTNPNSSPCHTLPEYL